ncbi:hypothetical protein HanPI659440_Chr17g0690231 [Helianthus annuus]|nr:hypothetical protein HanIR_Chr17g0884381 [Helianthus annuus]KAJ0637076.1 hypothetical protein HanOQP8_Chr17g0669511 [Helianthus annuus]KAJ0668515.1 hypothetical protein HanPI659440_Chr17g0690231 [Helianthus annuus]
MDSMDLKGIAWVGHIYQKFEAMCLEVEEAMSQETAKYVENQVQTVGAGMKRFCSDVMQDLLPPSSKDLSRVASADLLLNPYLEFGIHKKPISNIKEDAINIDPVRVKGISEDKSNSNNDVWEDWSAASFNWEISDKDEANCDEILNETPVTTVFTKPSAKVVKRSRRISSSNILRAERKGTCESNGVVPQAGSQATSNTSTSQSIDNDVSNTDSCENSRHVPLTQIGSNVGANAKCGQSVDDEIIWPHTGSSADCSPDLGEETKNGASVQIVEPIEDELDSGFEETCVLVDGNEYHLDSHKEESRRSYKKKIQNAFSLKKKSARKQEYKKLAAQCSIVHAEMNIKSDEAIPVAHSLSENVKANKLATHDSLELEWELL